MKQDRHAGRGQSCDPTEETQFLLGFSALGVRMERLIHLSLVLLLKPGLSFRSPM